MFISLSKTIARVGGFRLGAGMRVTKKNAVWASFIPLIIWFFQMMWYMIVFSFWLMYAMIYGLYWCIKKLVLSSKIKKEGNQA